jgi:hypothetical protein
MQMKLSIGSQHIDAGATVIAEPQRVDSILSTSPANGPGAHTVFVPLNLWLGLYSKRALPLCGIALQSTVVAQ